jgi:hypothetical protein
LPPFFEHFGLSAGQLVSFSTREGRYVRPQAKTAGQTAQPGFASRIPAAHQQPLADWLTSRPAKAGGVLTS